MRQEDVMRDTHWKIKNWEARRQALNLRPEHFSVALGKKDIHNEMSEGLNENQPEEKG